MWSPARSCCASRPRGAGPTPTPAACSSLTWGPITPFTTPSSPSPGPFSHSFFQCSLVFVINPLLFLFLFFIALPRKIKKRNRFKTCFWRSPNSRDLEGKFILVFHFYDFIPSWFASHHIISFLLNFFRRIIRSH